MRFLYLVPRMGLASGYPLSYFHHLDNDMGQTQFNPDGSQKDVATFAEGQLFPQDVPEARGFLGGPCDPTASPALLC